MKTKFIIGALEGQHFRQTGILVPLSEQNLVDCASNSRFRNHGCRGGLPEKAFEYIKVNDGIDTEQSYPYEAIDDTCRYSRENKGATDSGYMNIPEGDENALKNAIAKIGPIAVALDSHSFSFHNYRRGIYDVRDCSPTNLTHAVLIVGYGTENGQDYYIVKNSWGKTWGDDGFFKIARNSGNLCGIATLASYPTL